MRTKELLILVYIIVIALSVMYATHPLQPLLAKEFDIDVVKASSFTAVILFCLAVAPVIYGYILERFEAKKMLKISTAILFITNIFLGFSNSYEMFLVIRLVEGIVLPAILTASMSILANIDIKNVKFNMSIYVAATVFGGLIGRVMSGAIATTFGWRWVFFFLSLALLIAFISILKLNYKGEASLIRANVKDIKSILLDKRFATVYTTMFIVFFIFSGLLNILPFRIKDIEPDSSEMRIGLMYLGYSMGIIVSLLSAKIVKLFGSAIRTIIVAMLFYSVVTLFFISTDITFIFLLLFLFCIGMFTIHSISSGLANSIKEDKKSLTSGMYLTFYYIGGTLGSLLPAYLYQHFGWDKAVLSFGFIGLLLSLLLIKNKRYFYPKGG